MEVVRITKYVLQAHDAKNKHYDLRIMYLDNNKLASWALPKHNIPTLPGNRVLAVKTNDHAKSWLKFRGEIPKGSYGAGFVEILQSGNCEIYMWNDKFISFKIIGKHINGKYALLKYNNVRDQENWLLIKAKDN